MRCDNCRESLDALADAELSADERREMEHHFATCPDCARERDALGQLRTRLKEHLVRYTAPDVLKARVRADVARFAVPAPSPARLRSRWSLPMATAAALLVAALSSGVTLAVVRRASEPRITNELLASHIRSLMPDHLTDVVSSNQHNVKPWFNGRVDVSPTVPDLSSKGFQLVGGRLDYVNARAVPVIVYSRRSHLINVYEWPAGAAEHSQARSVNGYNFIEWSRDGMEYWAVSDLNAEELNALVREFER